MQPAKGAVPYLVSARDSWSMAIAAAAAGRLRRPLLVIPGTTVPTAMATYVKREVGSNAIVGVGSAKFVPDAALRTFKSPLRAAGAGPASLSTTLAAALPSALRGTRLTLVSTGSGSVAQAVIAAARGQLLLVVDRSSADLPASVSAFLQGYRDVSVLDSVATPAALVTRARRV
jgi:hypothetical protein